MAKIETQNTHLAIFKGKKIRKTIFHKEWWFSVVDVCRALTDSPNSGAYWRKLKQRLIEEGGQSVINCHGLKLRMSEKTFLKNNKINN